MNEAEASAEASRRNAQLGGTSRFWIEVPGQDGSWELELREEVPAGFWKELGTTLLHLVLFPVSMFRTLIGKDPPIKTRRVKR